MKSFHLQLCKKHENFTCFINLQSTYPEFGTTQVINQWRDDDLNYWSQTLTSKILLISLVYLSQCEDAILLNWWWENDNKILSKPDIKSSFGTISISTTVVADQTKLESGDPKMNIVEIKSTASENTKQISLFDKKIPLNLEIQPQTNDTHTEPITEEEEYFVFEKQFGTYNSVAREQTLKNNSTCKNTEMSGNDKSMKNCQENHRPIIGVLSQEQSTYLHSKYPRENFTSYIAASYVKLVEASGARVVPILIGKDHTYYRELVKKLNGVLLPGGATFFNQRDGFADAGQYIYEAALEINDGGGYFPIFGICLGFELLIILASGRGEQENRISCCSYSNCSLKFVDDFRSSKMFKNAPEETIDILSKEKITVNAHQFCITDQNLKSYDLICDWHVTSYSVDDNGVEFVATIENKRYPFYGVQFHPEKPAFEWKVTKTYQHTANAIQANRYFMDFFVKEAKKNHHHFEDIAEENKYLIYNYEPCFTGLKGSAYHQCYFFEPR